MRPVYLVHWPIALNPNGNPPGAMIPLLPDGTRDIVHSWKLSDTWAQLEALVKKGKVRSIGVSNFSVLNLEKILPTATIVPAVNQLELHVYNPQHKLLEYCRSKGITPQAYSPLGSSGSPLVKDEVVVSIAEKHGLTPVDVLIGYLLGKNIVALPKSVTPSRITANFTGGLSGLAKLTKEDIEKLDGLAAAGKQRRFVTPPWRMSFCPCILSIS